MERERIEELKSQRRALVAGQPSHGEPGWNRARHDQIAALDEEIRRLTAPVLHPIPDDFVFFDELEDLED